jgi:hypothetical protein
MPGNSVGTMYVLQFLFCEKSQIGPKKSTATEAREKISADQY